MTTLQKSNDYIRLVHDTVDSLHTIQKPPPCEPLGLKVIAPQSTETITNDFIYVHARVVRMTPHFILNVDHYSSVDSNIAIIFLTTCEDPIDQQLL